MLKEESVLLENELLRLMDELQMEAQCIPNMTHPYTPIGSEDCAVTSKTVSLLLFWYLFLHLLYIMRLFNAIVWGFVI